MRHIFLTCAIYDKSPHTCEHKPFHSLFRRAVWAGLQSDSPSHSIVMEEEHDEEHHHKTPHYAVDVSLIDDRMIHRMNKRHRGKDTPTNVLSFWDEEAQRAWHSVRGGSHVSHNAHKNLHKNLHRRGHMDGLGVWFLGDIILGYQTVMKESDALSIVWYRYASRLIIHGTLHLVGYTHSTEEAYRLMEDKADRAEKAWEEGITSAHMREYDEGMV